MATEFIPYSPVGGLNSDFSSDSIKNEEVQDCNNFVFSRGRAFTRQGARQGDFWEAAPLIWAKTIAAAVANTGTFFMTKSPAGVVKLFGFGGTEITGPGGLGAPLSAAAVNGYVLLGMGGQIVSYPPSGGAVYTLIAQGYNYLAGHNARALGAYDSTAPGYFNRVAWTVPGSVSDWVGVGSGHVDLSDSASYITGLGVINDTVIIPRNEGFHFGYPTGSGALPYRFETKSKWGIGLPNRQKQTATFFDDLMFFVGVNDIYLFSKEGLRAIGGNNKKEILRIVGGTRYFDGLVTTEFSGEVGVFYHLVPTWATLDGATSARKWASEVRQPHLVYSLLEDKWMKFSYPGNYGGGFEHQGGYVCVGSETNSQFYALDASTALEEEAFLLSKTFLMGTPDKDMTLRRVLLRYRDLGAHEVRVNASADINGERWGQEELLALGGRNDGKWKRKWANLQVAGNDFEYRVTVPPGNYLETNMIGGVYEPAPEYQGA